MREREKEMCVQTLDVQKISLRFFETCYIAKVTSLLCGLSGFAVFVYIITMSPKLL